MARPLSLRQQQIHKTRRLRVITIGTKIDTAQIYALILDYHCDTPSLTSLLYVSFFLSFLFVSI